MLRTVVIIYLVYVAVVVLVTVLTYSDANELRMRGWRTMARVCQGLARVLGQVGLYAERRYDVARGVV